MGSIVCRKKKKATEEILITTTDPWWHELIRGQLLMTSSPVWNLQDSVVRDKMLQVWICASVYANRTIRCIHFFLNVHTCSAPFLDLIRKKMKMWSDNGQWCAPTDHEAFLTRTRRLFHPRSPGCMMQLNGKRQGLSLYLSAGLSFYPERFNSDHDSALSATLEGLSLMHLLVLERVQ